jgi:hypothetical protein
MRKIRPSVGKLRVANTSDAETIPRGAGDCLQTRQETDSMKTNTFLLPIALSAILSAVLTGCAIRQAKGPAFSTPATPQPGKALVYFYRPPTEKHGYNRTYSILANGTNLPVMLHGGFYPVDANPGPMRVLSDTGVTWEVAVTGVAEGVQQGTARAAVLNFEVEAGKVYYVKCHPEEHTWYIKPMLYLVSGSVGESEIKPCKLISPKPSK